MSDRATNGSSDITSPDAQPHHDERQIGLDTDRSFVLYPVGGGLCQSRLITRLIYAFLDPEYDRLSKQISMATHFSYIYFGRMVDKGLFRVIEWGGMEIPL